MYFSADHHITAEADEDFRFHTANETNFVFQNGDIFLEDINAGIIMKSPNGQCWRGLMTDNGTLAFSQVVCPGDASSVPEQGFEYGKLKAYPNPTNGNLIIETGQYGPKTELAITNMEGRTIFRQVIFSDKTELNLSSFPAGTYLLHLSKNGSLVEQVKVIRQ